MTFQIPGEVADHPDNDGLPLECSNSTNAAITFGSESHLSWGGMGDVLQPSSLGSQAHVTSTTHHDDPSSVTTSDPVQYVTLVWNNELPSGFGGEVDRGEFSQSFEFQQPQEAVGHDGGRVQPPVVASGGVELPVVERAFTEVSNLTYELASYEKAPLPYVDSYSSKLITNV